MSYRLAVMHLAIQAYSKSPMALSYRLTVIQLAIILRLTTIPDGIDLPAERDFPVVTVTDLPKA